MIPKIVHYCWLSGDPVPDNLSKCMESWKRMLPDYEFMLWDKSRFDINSVAWVKEAYENKKYAFAADYIRLYAVYNYGGIYLDMDVEVLKPFDSILDREYVLGWEKKDGIEAGIFGAPPKAAWVRECLNYYDGRHFIDAQGNMDTLPLPKIMYKCLRPRIADMDILSNEYLTAKSYYTGEINATENTFCIHHFAGSWHSPMEKRAYELRSKFGWLPNSARGHLSKLLAIAELEGIKVAAKDEVRWLKRKLKN